MAKIIQIIDVGPDGTRVRLNDGSFVTLDHNAGPAPSIGDQVPQSTRTATGGAVSGTNNGTDRRAVIDAFIRRLAEAGRKISRKDIWTVAGYKNATEFERFQRGDTRTTRSAAAAFNRVLSKTPEDFIGLLDKKSTPK